MNKQNNELKEPELKMFIHSDYADPRQHDFADVSLREAGYSDCKETVDLKFPRERWPIVQSVIELQEAQIQDWDTETLFTEAFNDGLQVPQQNDEALDDASYVVVIDDETETAIVLSKQQFGGKESGIAKPLSVANDVVFKAFERVDCSRAEVLVMVQETIEQGMKHRLHAPVPVSQVTNQR